MNQQAISTVEVKITQHKVKIYSQLDSHGKPIISSKLQPDCKCTNAIDKFTCLFYQAAKCKSLNPTLNVSVDLCVYRIDDLEIIKAASFAAKFNVRIRILYHKSSINPQIWFELSKLKSVAIQQVNWGNGSDEKMHNKFQLVSTNQYVVHVSTANIDSIKKRTLTKWQQTSVVVFDNRDLFLAYKNYFEIIWKYGQDLKGYRKRMKTKSINFESPFFSVYFFPIAKKNLWDPKYNPLAHLLNKSKQLVESSNETNQMYMNMAFFRNDAFGSELIKRIYDVRDLAYIQNKEFPVRSVIMDERNANFPKFESKKHGLTHTKNYMFSFPSISEYYSITGSTNAKASDYLRKANNQLVILEKSNDHPIYTVFKANMDCIK